MPTQRLRMPLRHGRRRVRTSENARRSRHHHPVPPWRHCAPGEQHVVVAGLGSAADQRRSYGPNHRRRSGAHQRGRVAHRCRSSAHRRGRRLGPISRRSVGAGLSRVRRDQHRGPLRPLRRRIPLTGGARQGALCRVPRRGPRRGSTVTAERAHEACGTPADGCARNRIAALGGTPARVGSRFGAIAQVEERLHGMQEVEGSSPSSSTKSSPHQKGFRAPVPGPLLAFRGRAQLRRSW